MRQKRFLSWLLTLCLLLGMFSFPAYAEGNTTTISGDGTAEKTGTMTVTLVIPKKTPAATDLTYIAPSELTYSGSDKVATVNAKDDITGMGDITVKYYSDDGRTTEVAPKNIGTYYVGVTVAEGDQYAASTDVLHGEDWTFEITASTPDAPDAPTMASATKNSITLNAVDGCEYSKDGTTYQNSTEFTGLMPGTEYTFYQRVKATANTNVSSASSASFSTEADTYAMTITLTIKEMIVGAENVSVAYDGQPHGITVNVTDPASDYTVKFGTTEGTYDLDACPTQTEIGTLTVYYQVKADNYVAKTGSATVTINKTNAVAATVTANNRTYDGTDKPLVTVDDSTLVGGTMYYAVTTENTAPTDENLYTTSIPTGTDAGTYYVWYKVKGDNNHNDSTAKLIEVTISKAPLTVSADTKSKIYGEMDPELTYQVDGLKGSDTSDVVTGELMREAGNSVGTYKILQKADTKLQADNYEITYQDADFTITPRLLNFKWNYKNPFIYDGQTKSIAAEILNRVGDDDVTLGYTGNTGIAAMKYIAVINLLKGIAAGNYQLSIDESDRSQEWEIQKADNTVTVNITGWTYGKYSEETNEPFVTGVTFGADTVQYTYYMDADCQTKTNTANSGAAAEGRVPVNAGTYYVQAVILGTEDYNEVKAVESFVITPADITIQAEDQEGAYDTEIKTLTYQVTGDYATPVGEELYSDLGIMLTTEITKGSSVGTYPITVSYTENTNYNITVVDGNYNITKAALDVVASECSIEYDGEAHSITVNVNEQQGTVYYATEELNEDNYKTVGSTTAPTRTDVGSTTVYYYVESTNYDPNPITGSKDIVIMKAAPSVTAPVANTLTYTGEEQALASAGSTQEGTMVYSLDGENYAENIPTAINAGEYTVYYKVVGDKNHRDSEAATISVRIDKAATENKVVTDIVEIISAISAGATDETIDLNDYLNDGARLEMVEKYGELADAITAGTLEDGIFTYSVAENDGGLTGTITLIISSDNYQDYTIKINLASVKKNTEELEESKEVEEPVDTSSPGTPKTGDALPKYTFWMMLASAGICIVAGSTKRRKKE